MKELLFENLTFTNGVNVTVRKGVRWSGESGTVIIAGVNDPTQYYGEIINAAIWRFCDIPKSVLKLEHDPKCRKRHGLFSVMRKVYPGFYHDEVVTVVFFTVRHQP